MDSIIIDVDAVIIGAGLTGLSTATHLTHAGKNIVVLEQSNRVGGQIQTLTENGFTFESGPNTGSGASPEVLELFDITSTPIEFARKDAERRLIWKGDRFHELPSSLIGGIRTPLFSWHDKFRILGEPWRQRGTNPDETVGELTVRRLGKSFLDYAVDPFLSGVYAGDPFTLVTRHALPKLYNLEQNYGSFIRGAMAKAQEKKKAGAPQPTEPKGKTNIFSAHGGLERLVEGMAKYIGTEHIHTGIRYLDIRPTDDEKWLIGYKVGDVSITLRSPYVITTVGAYALPDVLRFIYPETLAPITDLVYAPIIQVSVGIKDTKGHNCPAFGGLVSSKENKDVLGILFPSSCFSGRAPEGGLLLSYFMGGMKHRDIMSRTNTEIEESVVEKLHSMLHLPQDIEPDMIRIFRHSHAIPQYEASSEQRFMRIDELQGSFPGLIIGGNLRDGIGMAHRMTQGKMIAQSVLKN